MVQYFLTNNVQDVHKCVHYWYFVALKKTNKRSEIQSRLEVCLIWCMYECVYVCASDRTDGMVMEQKGEVSLLALLSCRIYKNGGMVLVFIHRNTHVCNKVRVQHCAWQAAGIKFTPNTFSVYCIQYPLYSIPERTFLWNKRGLHLHVETAMPAGTLMLLLMTAKTLMLYSTPASRPEMVQAVLLPGILISNGTPDTETGRRKRQSVYIHMPFLWSRLDAFCLPPVLLGVYVTKKSVSTTEPSHSRSTLRSVPPRIFRFMTGATKIRKNFRYLSNIRPPFVHVHFWVKQGGNFWCPTWFYHLLPGSFSYLGVN